MLRVRRTKWVFKGETCQANVYPIAVLSEKHFLRCNQYVSHPCCGNTQDWSHLAQLYEIQRDFNDCLIPESKHSSQSIHGNLLSTSKTYHTNSLATKLVILFTDIPKQNVGSMWAGSPQVGRRSNINKVMPLGRSSPPTTQPFFVTLMSVCSVTVDLWTETDNAKGSMGPFSSSGLQWKQTAVLWSVLRHEYW